MDTYQGRMKTISPAIGPYDITVFIDIDKNMPITGVGDNTGVTGTGSLEPIKWDMGVTGINPDNFKNARHGF
jgi:hypothetical protein